MKKSTFGHAYIKQQGAAVHPDELNPNISDAYYIRQGEAYIQDTEDVETTFSRDYLKINRALRVKGK